MLGDKNWDEREGDSYRALLRSHSDLVMILTCQSFLLASHSYFHSRQQKTLPVSYSDKA